MYAFAARGRATEECRRLHPYSGGVVLAPMDDHMWKVGLGTLLVIATQAHAEVVQLAELPDHVTEGRVVVDATPDEIYYLVTDYSRWPGILSDIRSVNVERGGPHDARVEFRSNAIGRAVTVEFDNDPGHSISFRGVEGPPGGRASGHYALIALDDGKRTLVIARLYMDIVGAPSLFVRDKTVREMRRAKLESDLADIARYFAVRAKHD